MPFRFLLVLVLLASACGDDSSTSDAGMDVDADLADVPQQDAPGSDAGPVSDAATSDVPVDGGPPSLTVRITASGDVFPHADLLGGQTARATSAGVRSLALYRSMVDPDPLVLFQAEGADVEVGYNPGDDTVLTTVDASSLAAGSFTFARLVQSYGRYEVDATLHRVDGSHEGAVSAFQVIADGTDVDGETFDAGHYDLTFAGDVTAEWSGEDGVFPTFSATAGAIGIVEDGEWAVYFPIELEIVEPPTSDATLTIDVNMFESFRWTDLLLLGYLPGVFDVTDISFEPVVRFGGNSFELTTTF